MADLRHRQAQLHVKFSNLRAGIVYEGSSRKAAELTDRTRPQAWRNRAQRHAWPRQPGCVYPPRGVTAEEAAELQDERVLYSGIRPRITLDRGEERDGRTIANQVARHLAGLGFRYFRTLGWGGEGLATLFYVSDGMGGWKKVVAKMSYHDNPSFANEVKMGMQFRGRDHILQRQLGPDLAVGDMQGRIDEALRTAETRMVLFEFAQFGSLARLLSKASDPVTSADDPIGIRADRGRPLPDRALLHIMLCLANACNDLRNPVAIDRDGRPTGNNVGPVVHFDFEPSNLLFGGGETVVQPEHTLMPILKVSDFGLATAIPTDMNTESKLGLIWGLRSMAKSHYFLPEQFSQDWDWVDRHPLQENIDTYGKVAGHYGPASNVYHLGLALWSCITGAQPPLPTHPRLVANPVPRRDGTVWFTWFAEILDDSKYGNVDLEIRQIVLACLAEEPRQRMDSQDLLEWCTSKMNQLRQIPGSTDGDLYAWAVANMSAPPEPSAETPVPILDFNPNDPSNAQFNPFDQEWQL